MAPRSTRGAFWMSVVMLLLLAMAVMTPMRVEAAAVTLSGTVKAVSGSSVTNVQISVTNTATGDVASLTLEGDGPYTISGLAAGSSPSIMGTR